MNQKIAAIVLAAGMSRRMGTLKALLPLGGVPMIARVVETIAFLNAVDPIIVVTGHEAGQVMGALEGFDVEFVQNECYESGDMISSVKLGCSAVSKRCDWLFLVLGDQPLVRAETFQELIHPRWREATIDTPRGSERRFAPSRMLQPSWNGRRGHPVLFPASSIPAILALAPGATLKCYTQNIETLEISVDDPGVVADIDTPGDYDQAVLRFNADRSEACKSKG